MRGSATNVVAPNVLILYNFKNACSTSKENMLSLTLLFKVIANDNHTHWRK